MTYWHAAVLCAVMVVMEAILSWHGATLFKMVLSQRRYQPTFYNLTASICSTSNPSAFKKFSFLMIHQLLMQALTKYQMSVSIIESIMLKYYCINLKCDNPFPPKTAKR